MSFTCTARNFVDEPVGDTRGYDLEENIVFTVAAPSKGHLIPIVNLLQQRRNVSRIILEVAINGGRLSRPEHCQSLRRWRVSDRSSDEPLEP